MITESNLMIELNNCVNDLTMFLSGLQIYEPGTLSVDEVKALHSEFEDALEHMPDIIDKISEWQPDPAVVGNKTKRYLYTAE